MRNQLIPNDPAIDEHILTIGLCSIKGGATGPTSQRQTNRARVNRQSSVHKTATQQGSDSLHLTVFSQGRRQLSRHTPLMQQSKTDVKSTQCLPTHDRINVAKLSFLGL